MENNKFSDKLSLLEWVLIILLLLCYIGTLVFLVIDNRPLNTLFFVLHSCLCIILILIIHDRMSRLLLDQNDNASHQLEDELQMITQYKEDIASLKDERDSLLIEKEQLSAQYTQAQQQIVHLTTSLEQEQHTAEVVNLNQLLPENENPIDLNIIAAARTVIDEMLPYSRQAGIQLSLSSMSDELMVRADAAFIRILFRNIIDNSIKYMNRNGSLVITISNIGDDLFIVLKDNGEGLATSETTRIFELNYQGSNRISGNGLGLTQAKAIVEYYGGTIYAKSELGKGMGIYIQLPTSSH